MTCMQILKRKIKIEEARMFLHRLEVNYYINKVS